MPRALALCTTGLENYAVPLGLGKWITSVTMTVFYVLLYYVWRRRYHINGQKGITIAVYLLSALRILLCLFPQNAWTSADQVVGQWEDAVKLDSAKYLAQFGSFMQSEVGRWAPLIKASGASVD